jgi:hypothetical protein
MIVCQSSTHEHIMFFLFVFFLSSLYASEALLPKSKEIRELDTYCLEAEVFSESFPSILLKIQQNKPTSITLFGDITNERVDLLSKAIHPIEQLRFLYLRGSFDVDCIPSLNNALNDKHCLRKITLIGCFENTPTPLWLFEFSNHAIPHLSIKIGVLK